MPTESAAALIARLLELPESELARCWHDERGNQPGLPERLQRLAEILTATESASRGGSKPTSDEDRRRIIEFAFAAADSGSAMIGPYKLLQKIGEGGFGIVWMAEQQEPVRRRVALKVIKTGTDTREVIARFEAERQTLALMDHPHIARVFEAGETDLGRPYFAMELVRGIPITKYCDENRLPTEARLQLFIAVCQAVQHAHQKGIIHRDLKPSNILVTLHDGVPMPKIIDFGIAKATETPLTKRTLFTQFHAFIGTPAYTSPEQMEMSGLDVDTRSDIYSLGILLYELLAGHPPFDPDQLLKSGLEEMRRTIRETEPPRPSSRVRTLSEALGATVARQRSTDTAKLAVLLRGDLDWIVMRCLEKDRTRRYDTANSLAADVRNFLADETVSARPPSNSYRLRKFIRRHRLGFAAGVAIAISLIAGLVISSVLLVSEHAARERAVAAETKESGLRQTSTQIAQFMTDMLKGVRPSVALGRDTKLLREILDATARRLDNELHAQPAVAANLRDTLGSVYLDLGQYAIAEPLLRQAVATHRILSGSESVETAASLHQLGVTLRKLNRSADAEAALQEALVIRQKLIGPETAAVADTLYELALTSNPQGSESDKQVRMRNVLAIRRKIFGAQHPAVAQAIAGLGYMAQATFDHESAVALHAEALTMRRRLLGANHPDIASSLDALGSSLTHLDRAVEGAAAYREAFDIRRGVLGDQHPEVVVSLLRYAGEVPGQNHDSEALATVRGFVASQRKLLPPGSILLAPSLLALASLESTARDSTAAENSLREAHSLLLEWHKNPTPLDAEIIEAMSFFGWAKYVHGKADEGVILAEEAMRLAPVAFSAKSGRMVLPTHILAWVYLGARRWEEGAKQFEAAVRVTRAVLGEKHPFVQIDLAGLAACYRETNRLAEAHQLMEAALASPELDFGKPGSPPNVAHLLCELGLTLLREGRATEAETMLRRALASYDRRELRSISLQLRPRERAATGLARALTAQGSFAEAELLVVQAFQQLKANEQHLAGDRAGTVRDALDAVIELYTAWGKPEKVAEWRNQIDALPHAQP